MKNAHHKGGRLEPKWVHPYIIVEVKESSGCITKDKYSKNNEKVIPIDQVRLYFDEALRPDIKRKNGR